MADETVTKADALADVNQQWIRNPIHTLYDSLIVMQSDLDTAEAAVAALVASPPTPSEYHGGITGDAILPTINTTWTLVPFFEYDNTVNVGVTPDFSTSKLTITQAGDYWITMHCSGTCVATEDITFSWFKNGVEGRNFTIRSYAAGFSVNVFDFVTAAENDYFQPYMKMATGNRLWSLQASHVMATRIK